MTSIPYETPALPPDLPFDDQRGGMKAMGIILILVGVIFACFTAMTPMAMLAPKVQGQPSVMGRDLVVGAGMYALGAGLLITAGVGALRAKRWSRPVVLIITGSWVVGGAVSLVTWLLIGPDIQRAMASAGAAGPGTGTRGGPSLAGVTTAIRVIVPLAILVFGVLLPGGIFWFFVRDNVRRTVDYFDHAEAWTDRCPTPVLALSAWLGLLSLFAMSYCLWGIFPWFGRLLSGTPATVALLVVALLLAVLAVGTFRLRRPAWLGTVALLIVYAASSMTTFSRVDPAEIYRLSGYPPEMAKMAADFQSMSPAATTLGTAVYAAVSLAYLVWVWRYFRRREAFGAVGAQGAS